MKKKILVFLTIIILSLGFIVLFGDEIAYTSPDLIDGIISYYNLDEAGGNAIDAHGSNDGSVSGATQGATGKINDAYSFDGNDVVTLTSAITSGSDFTITAWINADTIAGGWDVICGYDGNHSFYNHNGKPSVYDLSRGGDLAHSNSLSVGTYSFVAAVITSTDGVWIYLDGVFEKVSADSVGNDWEIQYIGARSGPGEYFVGDIDEVGIWTRALSEAELDELYNSGDGLAYPFGATPPPPPCETHNVWGYAWSDNIGWISFSCKDCDDDLDGFLDGGACGVGNSVNYGVDVDEATGEFSGYAWSDNIGWISFNSGELAGCPSAPCEARLDLDGTTCGEIGQVCGWARALAPVGDPNAGGWDGWIKLRGLTNEAVPQEYGVSLNPAPTPSEFESWAWGGGYSGGNIGAGVIGWISFNDRDFDGSPGPFDYQVMTDITFTLNDIPSATNLSVVQTSGCESVPIVRFSWDYNDDDNVPPGTDPQSAYEIEVSDAGGLIDTLSGGSDTSRDYSPPSFGTTYWWRVKVQDTNGPVWSDWANGPNFTPAKWPEPDFTWCPEEPDVDETIQFCSVFEVGVCDNAAEPACNLAGDLTTCAAGCVLWEWDFDNDGFPEIVSTDNPTYSYSSAGDYTVRLTVTDADGCSCSRRKDISADIPLPIWKEIPPF